MVLRWSKELTPSDAQQEGGSKNMPLRLTGSGSPHDYRTWFREVFFGDADWHESISRGRQIDEVQVAVHVNILGNDLGVRQMIVNHDDSRATKHHDAPPTHLRYDDETKTDIEEADLTDYFVVLERDDANQYHLKFQATAPNPMHLPT